MEITTFIVSLFGGGIIGAIINWASIEHNNKKKREIEYLDKQINQLYGPLYYWVSRSKILLEFNNKIHEEYKTEYSDKKFSQNVDTQKNLEKETSVTLEIANEYVDLVVENNNKIKGIFDNNYSLIDSNDINISLLFYEHHIRMEVERDEKKLKTPVRIYNKLGNISYLPHDFAERIESQFMSKKNKLDTMISKEFD